MAIVGIHVRFPEGFTRVRVHTLVSTRLKAKSPVGKKLALGRDGQGKGT
jgi:hypothetical protein